MIKKYQQNEIRGNTVLAPQYEPNTSPQKDLYRELKKSQIESLHKKREKNIQGKLKILGNIMLVFVVGMVIIVRYSTIYTMQKKLLNTKNSIATLTKENENLKVELVKFNNLQYIEDTAISKLHMVRPDRKQVRYSNLTKENFATQPKNVTEKKEKNIIEKIKNILF